MWKELRTGIIFSLSPLSGIVFENSVLQKLEEYIQIDKNSKEAGGILIGEKRGDNYHVSFITEPQVHDRRSRCSFCRNDKKHLEKFTELYKKNPDLSYLGEWHTHPEKTPIPSKIDINEWEKISKKIPKFIVLIIGTENYYCNLI